MFKLPNCICHCHGPDSCVEVECFVCLFVCLFVFQLGNISNSTFFFGYFHIILSLTVFTDLSPPATYHLLRGDKGTGNMPGSSLHPL